ncbi:unnamed protein product, partial [Rotaria sordida]
EGLEEKRSVHEDLCLA